MTAIEPPTLRPLTLNQLLDRAIRLYRQNFLAFIGIIATALIPLSIFDYVVTVLNFQNMERATQQMQSASAAGDTPASRAFVQRYPAGGTAAGSVSSKPAPPRLPAKLFGHNFCT